MNFSNEFINEKDFQKSKDLKQRLTSTLNGLSNHCQVLQDSKQEESKVIFELPLPIYPQLQPLHSARGSSSSIKSISMSASSNHAQVPVPTQSKHKLVNKINRESIIFV